MNYSLAIFLISTKVKAINVSFNAEVEGRSRKLYMFKSMDDSLEVGDLVTVPSSLDSMKLKMSVAQIVEVDVEVDFDSSIEFKWIIGKINQEDFQDITLQENTAITKIRAAEKNRKRKELSKDLDELAGDELKLLELYQPGEQPALETTTHSTPTFPEPSVDSTDIDDDTPF